MNILTKRKLNSKIAYFIITYKDVFISKNCTLVFFVSSGLNFLPV